jgi:hypothetical protein
LTRFIETHDGSFFNLDRVHRLQPTKIDGERAYAAVTDDGVQHCYPTAAQALFPVIPANAGFALLRVWFDNAIPVDLSDEISRTPIIGWRLTTSGAEPITFDGECSEGASPHIRAVECPDGQIVILSYGYGTYRSFDHFVDGVRRRWRMFIEIAAAKTAASG